jgi:hypothetical protein
MRFLAISRIASRHSEQASAGVVSMQQAAGKTINLFLIICESTPIESICNHYRGNIEVDLVLPRLAPERGLFLQFGSEING